MAPIETLAAQDMVYLEPGNTIMHKKQRNTNKAHITKTNNEISKRAFFCYMMMIIIMTIALPDNIMELSPSIYFVTEKIGKAIPSISKIGRESNTPQIAQLILIIELFSMPILAFIFIRETSIEGSISKAQKHPLRFLLITPLIILLLSWSVIFFFPGLSNGHGPASRISEAIKASRIGLAFWSSILYGGVGAVSILMAYLYIKIFPHVVIKQTSQQ